MKSRQNLKFSVQYPRTAQWWASGGKWYEISTWCNNNFKNWDYINETFKFESQQDKNWFLLRWM